MHLGINCVDLVQVNRLARLLLTVAGQAAVRSTPSAHAVHVARLRCHLAKSAWTFRPRTLGQWQPESIGLPCALHPGARCRSEMHMRIQLSSRTIAKRCEFDGAHAWVVCWRDWPSRRYREVCAGRRSKVLSRV